MRSLPRLCLLILPLLLAACAGNPRFDPTGINTELTPRAAVQNAEAARGEEVLWGGVVVNSANLADATQIEVLGYPLNDAQRPQIEGDPTGRFLAVKPGYLETADFAQGRPVTIRGTVIGTDSGRVGEAEYRYPVVQISDTQLWNRENGKRRSDTQFHFGLGVLFGN